MLRKCKSVDVQHDPAAHGGECSRPAARPCPARCPVLSAQSRYGSAHQASPLDFFCETAGSVSGESGIPLSPASTMSRLAGASPPAASLRGLDGNSRQRGHVPPPVAALGVSGTSPLSFCRRCSISQCARRCCAPRKCWGVTSPVLRKYQSVRWCAVIVSARWRLVLDQPSPAAWLGTVFVAVVALARYGTHCVALRVYIGCCFVKWPPVAALKLRLVASTALRPAGFTKPTLCKVPPLECGRVSRRRFPVADAPYAPPTVRPWGGGGTVASVRRCARCFAKTRHPSAAAGFHWAPMVC